MIKNINNMGLKVNDFNLAIAELGFVETNVHQTIVLGYETQIEKYKSFCRLEKIKESYREGVMFQTEFIEEIFKDFLFNKRKIPTTLTKIRKWRKELIDNQNNETIDWDTIICHTEPNNLQDILIQHQNKMSDEVYWSFIAHCYTMSDLAHTNEFTVNYFLKSNRPNKHFLMTEEERAFLKDLPQKITIYRGCSKKEIKSKKIRYSWTLKKSIAEYFAFEYINYAIEKSTVKDKSKYEVIERTIDKSEIYAYFEGREEEEIIYFPQD